MSTITINAPVATPDETTRIARIDPRIPFALLLTVYAVAGCTVLRFNRTPLQMLVTVAATCALDVFFARVIQRRWLVPLSAYISGLSLALLLNYARDSWILLLPVFLTVASKYVLTFEGRHVFNPSMFGVAVSLLIGGDLITTAPAYQWGGSVAGTWAMSAFLIAAAFALFVFRVGRTPLILSFLGFYGLQILLRAYWMRWYLPPESLILGTLTSAPFFLFVFYMITDPKTSPSRPRDQVLLAFALTAVDLLFHTRGSLYTFFYAALVVAAARFVFLHARRLVRRGAASPGGAVPFAAWRRGAAVVAATGAVLYATYAVAVQPFVAPPPLTFDLVRLDPAQTGVSPRLDGSIIEQADPRVRHIAKWLLSAGDAAAAADFDNDGRLDLFLCGPFKTAEDRAILYRNTGGLRFERVRVPALERVVADPRRFGIISSGTFADLDNDGDKDLFLTVGYGRSLLLRNELAERGAAEFTDVSARAGTGDYTISIAANFLDFDRDGRLDIFVANALDPLLREYDPPRPLSIFDLQRPEHPGDRRMLPFMHSSWDNARNGGPNLLYRNAGGNRFTRLDSAAAGLPETHWSLSVATADFNGDARTDLYVANDFGPDDFYLSEGGGRFRKIEGRIVGEISHDTYKGMNASQGDVDRNGYPDVYVSNVHMPLQAEGSLLWMTYPRGDGVELRDEANQRGALNEHRFGWGGAMGDLDNDGWLDILQANGMIDDAFDRRFAQCRDYWYVNEKLMRSGPEIHTYADMWGDLRGYCINGRESNRVYLSRGDRQRLQFADVAPRLGWTEEPPSRGVLLADFDDDGDLDVGITHITAPLTLYRNTRNERGGRWIGFDVRGNGTTCNRDAAGTRVAISYDENGRTVTQMREISIVNAFAAQGDRRALFGLGEHRGDVDVTISWCGGPTVRTRVAANRYHTIEQPR